MQKVSWHWKCVGRIINDKSVHHISSFQQVTKQWPSLSKLNRIFLTNVEITLTSLLCNIQPTIQTYTLYCSRTWASCSAICTTSFISNWWRWNNCTAHKMDSKKWNEPKTKHRKESFNQKNIFWHNKKMYSPAEVYCDAVFFIWR